MTDRIVGYLQNWESYALSLGVLLSAVVCGLILHYLLFKFMARVSRGFRTITAASIVKYCRPPSRLLLPLLVLRLSLPLAEMTPEVWNFADHTLGLGIILALAWLMIKLAYVGEALILHRFDTTEKDNLRARRMHTQIVILRRIVIAVIVVLAFATILMSFSKVRQLGTSILASAGILGIILGFAAQRSIATLFAGFQVAVAQPIRLDDVVIVENEWGRIEEITLTYVVVRIWDLRRLVVPVTYFLEKPFQNWTRVSANLLGSVFVYVDYSVPVQAVREALQRIVENSEHWDGNVCVLQVTDVSEHTLQLRALMSASDSSRAWELRCQVRERLVEFIQKTYPEALPLLRTELRGPQDIMSKTA
jgi:small-conductance mechanosensitive channel